MKTYGLLFVVFVSLCSCKSDSTISAQAYDGEYPYIKQTGQTIPIYQPVFIRAWQVPPTTAMAMPVPATGQYSFVFKGHNWNHWPYMNLSFRLIANPSPPFDRIGTRIFGISVAAMSGYDCSMESVGFIIPAQTGAYHFGRQISYEATNPFFQTIECDVVKDRIVANESADNWVNVTRLDTLANQVEGSFDLSFSITRRDTTYSLVYPTHMHLQRRFNGPFQKR